MSTVIRKRDNQGGYRLLNKGASEIVLNKCAFILNSVGEAEILTNSNRQKLIDEVVERMASNGLRTICLAYRDFVPSNASINQTTYRKISKNYHKF